MLRSLLRGPRLGQRLAASCRVAVIRPARRKLCDSAALKSAEAPAAEGFGAWLAREGQVDSGMWQGAALLGGVLLGVQAASDEQRKTAVTSLLAGYRVAGLDPEHISDKVLIQDFVRKNAAAACNVLMASPAFYFLFAKIHGCSVAVSSVRAITGTLRIVPFMGAFYGLFAVICPFVTSYFMGRGQSYDEARGTASIAVMLSGFVFIEAVVELRGCGVTFAQMAPSSFLIFIPALVGRLATGVLTQQEKVGQESEPLLPESWRDGPTWQQHTYMTFDMLALDKEFLVTCAGTTVFQHILNGITWVLLSRGKTASLVEICKFIVGGMNGTALSGLSQFGKTFVMRFGFGWTWNWCTTQQLPMPVFDAVLAENK